MPPLTGKPEKTISTPATSRAGLLVVVWCLIFGVSVASSRDGNPYPTWSAGEPNAQTGSGGPRALPGIVIPGRRVSLGTPVSGVLMQIAVEEGEQVREGQLLAVMDNRIPRAELRVAEAIARRAAQVTKAERELQLAENLLARLLSVADRRAVSELEVDQARADRDKAQALLDQAREQQAEAAANLDLARTRLEAHNIRAPFSGRILDVRAEVGQTVRSDDTLMTLVNLDCLKAELYVPIEWYEKMAPGEAFALIAAPPIDRNVAARLVVRDPVMDAATRTFRCCFEIDNRKARLPAGFTVRLVRPTPVEKAP